MAVVVRNLDHGHWLVAWQENLGAYSFHWSKMLLHLPDDCQCLRKRCPLLLQLWLALLDEASHGSGCKLCGGPL